MRRFQKAVIVIAILFFVFFASLPACAQQNNTLFFMHTLPEAHYLNPAVQMDCGVFIGLPVISSTHVNIANSGFTADNAVILYTDGTVDRKPDLQVPAFPARKYFLSELHTVLLAAGLKRNDYYFSFTVTEKNNSIVIYTPDLVHLIYRGSSQFEGQRLAVKGTRAVFNHAREYALGISKEYTPDFTAGIRIKLMTGIFNFNTGNASFGFSVEEGTRDILFDMDGGYNSSLPWALQERAPGIYRIEEVNEAPWFNRLMNARNPGLAIDLGFIYRYDDRWTFSGSLLDAGVIWYRSNISNYTVSGNVRYTGPSGQVPLNEAYLWDRFDDLNRTGDESLSFDPYSYNTDPRIYLGASRTLQNRQSLNFLLYNRYLPGRIQSGATVSFLTDPGKALQGSLSWSYMNGSILNLGTGIVYGKRPLQVYAVTDNIFGLIWPLSTKNVNLRCGINLNLGCGKSSGADEGNCAWLKSERREWKKKFRRGKN